MLIHSNNSFYPKMNFNFSLNNSFYAQNSEVDILVNDVFSGGSDEKRRVSSIINDLCPQGESPEAGHQKLILELKNIIDPDGKDPEINISAFRNGCTILALKYLDTEDNSPISSPIKCIQNGKGFSPQKCSSPMPLSDSEVSMCSSSSPSTAMYVENVRLTEENEELKYQIKNLQSKNKDLLEQLASAEDELAKFDNFNKLISDSSQKTKYELLLKDLDELNRVKNELESRNNDLLRHFKVRENEWAAENMTYKELLENERSETDKLKSELDEVQNHAKILHKEREACSEELKKSKLQNEVLKEDLREHREIEGKLNARINKMEKEINSLQRFKAENKFLHQQDEQLQLVLDVLQSRLPPAQSIDEDSSEQVEEANPKCLKEELGGFIPALNLSADLDDSAVLSTSAVESDQAAGTPYPVSSKFVPTVETAVDEVASLVVLPKQTPQRIFSLREILLAILFFLLYTLSIIAIVMFCVVSILSPYLDVRTLLRVRPWFVSVGEGSLGPVPL